MDQIIIKELELFVRVGVPQGERAKAQRLLANIEMDHDFSAAIRRDRIEETIDYHAVSIRLASFTKKKSWKLIETLATDMAELILREFKPTRVTVEIQKFILPQTEYVAVRVVRPRDNQKE